MRTTTTTGSKQPIRPSGAVPEREAWLVDNQAARESVLRGIEQARQGRMSRTPPDPAELLRWSTTTT